MSGYQEVIREIETETEFSALLSRGGFSVEYEFYSGLYYGLPHRVPHR